MKPGARPHCGIITEPAVSGEPGDVARRLDVLGQVEIMDARGGRAVGDVAGEREGHRRKHRELARERARQRLLVGHVEAQDFDALMARDLAQRILANGRRP